MQKWEPPTHLVDPVVVRLRKRKKENQINNLLTYLYFKSGGRWRPLFNSNHQINVHLAQVVAWNRVRPIWQASLEGRLR